jgi:hypothetical protein
MIPTQNIRNTKNSEILEIIANSKELSSPRDRELLENHYNMFRNTLDNISGKDISLQANLNSVCKHSTTAHDYSMIDGANHKAVEMTKVITKDFTDNEKTAVVSYFDRLDFACSKIGMVDTVLTENPMTKQTRMREMCLDIVKNRSEYEKIDLKNYKVLQASGKSINEISFNICKSNTQVKIAKVATYDDFKSSKWTNYVRLKIKSS